MSEERRTFILGRDQANRAVQLVVEGDRLQLKRAGGVGVAAATIDLTREQLRDICMVALK